LSSISIGISVRVRVCIRICIRIGVSITSSSSSSGRILCDNKVTKSGFVKQVEHALAGSIKRGGLSLLAQGRNKTIDINIRVDERGDASQRLRHRESRVRAHILSIAVGIRVGVLFCGDVGNGGVDGVLPSTKISYDLVCGDKLN
jgi:hypothetical protein